MPVDAILNFCKEKDIPITAVSCSPHFDASKGRVKKGNTVPHKDWKKKGRFQQKDFKNDPNGKQSSVWMMDLRKAGMYVLDLDIEAEDVQWKQVIPQRVWDNLLGDCTYIVQTGSGGVHFYFKYPDGVDSKNLKNKVKVAELNEGWVEQAYQGKAEWDIIFDSIVVEGSTYTFENNSFSYVPVKPGSSIRDVDASLEDNRDIPWLVLSHQVPTLLGEDKGIAALCDGSKGACSISKEEFAAHLENIPNRIRNWDSWYKMGQCIFNTNPEWYDLFERWSSRNPCHNDKECWNLWKGLRERPDGTTKRGAGSVLHLSKMSNEAKYKEIRDTYAVSVYQAAKQEYEQTWFFVEEPRPMYVRQSVDGLMMYEVKSAREILADKFIERTNAKGEMENIEFFEMWRRDPARRKYRRIDTYPPPMECPADIFNDWVPPIASLIRSDLDGTEGLNKVLHHIDVLSDNDKKAAHFLLGFFAQLLQQPAKVPGICMVIYGLQGTGKDTLFEEFGSKVLGKHLYWHIDPEQLFDKFNGERHGKLLIHAEEICRALLHSNSNKLKQQITSTDIKIEGKGKDSCIRNSFARIVMTTNNKDALKIEPSDRRNCVLNSSDEHLNDMGYFEDLRAQFAKPEVVKALYDYLMNFDISGFNHTQRPITRAYKDMKKLNIDPVMEFIAYDDSLDAAAPVQLKASEWLSRYNFWAASNNRHSMNNTVFGLQLASFLEKGIGITKQRPKGTNHYTIDKAAVIAYLTKEGYLDA